MSGYRHKKTPVHLYRLPQGEKKKKGGLHVSYFLTPFPPLRITSAMALPASISCSCRMFTRWYPDREYLQPHLRIRGLHLSRPTK